jgi:hypothetical protein
MEIITERAVLTADEAMAFLFPRPERGYLRLVISGAATASELYFWHRDGRWRLVGQHAPGKEPTLADVIAETRWGRITFAPILRVAPTDAALGPVDAVVVRWSVPLIQGADTIDSTRPAGHPGLSRVLNADRRACSLDHETRAKRLARIESIEPIPPHVLLDAGDTLTAIWRLRESLVEPAAAGFEWSTMRSTQVAHRLALRLGGDVVFADEPVRATLDLPSAVRASVAPSFTVTATRLRDGAVPIEALEDWARS